MTESIYSKVRFSWFQYSAAHHPVPVSYTHLKTFSGPHIRTANTTRNIMLHVAISLMPALLGSIYFFGIRSLYITGLSVTVCVLTEYIWQKPVSYTHLFSSAVISI